MEERGKSKFPNSPAGALATWRISPSAFFILHQYRLNNPNHEQISGIKMLCGMYHVSFEWEPSKTRLWDMCWTSMTPWGGHTRNIGWFTGGVTPWKTGISVSHCIMRQAGSMRPNWYQTLGVTPSKQFNFACVHHESIDLSTGLCFLAPPMWLMACWVPGWTKLVFRPPRVPTLEWIIEKPLRSRSYKSPKLWQSNELESLGDSSDNFSSTRLS